MDRKNYLTIPEKRDKGILAFLEKDDEIFFLTERTFQPRDDGTEVRNFSRVINHWEEIGIVDDPRMNKKGWRKYTIVEYLWIRIVIELRRFDISNDIILKAKKDLALQTGPFIESNGKIGANALFMFYVSCAMFSNKSISLLVFANGEALFLNEHERQHVHFDRGFGNYISLNVNLLIEDCLPNIKNQPNTMN